MNTTQDRDLKDYLIAQAHENSYNVIVGNATASEIMSSETPHFAHEIFGPVTSDIIDYLIDYFEELEEYEKCAKLKSLWSSVITKRK